MLKKGHKPYMTIIKIWVTDADPLIIKIHMKDKQLLVPTPRVKIWLSYDTNFIMFNELNWFFLQIPLPSFSHIGQLLLPPFLNLHFCNLLLPPKLATDHPSFVQTAPTSSFP